MAGDRSNQLIENSVEFQIDYQGGANPVYIGRAVKIGALTSDTSWQLRKLSYDGSGNPVRQQFPQDSGGQPSNAYDFVWDNHASYVYG
jgi:YD repeat-containing protein